MVGLALFALHFQTGLAGCDQGPSAKDTASTTEGDPVDVGGGTPGSGNPNPSDNNPPPGGETPSGGAGVQSPVKNVILLIGSGMGPQQIGQIVQYRRLRKPTEDKLALEKLMDGKVMGMMTTNSYLDLVSDTAASTSSMACGLKARNNTVGLDANGKPCESILEKAGKLGKATGIISTAPVTHPSVSGFLTHQIDGTQSNAIAESLITDLNVDLVLAGGAENLIPQQKETPTASATRSRGRLALALSLSQIDWSEVAIDVGPKIPFIPENPPESTMKFSDLADCAGVDDAVNGYSKREDQKNVVEEIKAKGYQFVCKKDQLSALNGESGKTLGIFSNSHFPRSPERKGLSALPSLADMTGKALEVLGAKEKGFVLVVENSMTQLASQENDPGTLLQEGLEFDAALAVALTYTEQNPDTLLIVTSDHDTAGFAFAYSKQPGSEVDLPSGDHYDQPYNYAPAIRFDTLIEQQKSLYKLTYEVLEKLYAPTSPISLDEAATQLVGDVQANSKYTLGIEQAKQVLYRPAGLENAQTKDFSSFYVNDNIHANLLARAIAPQTSTVWSAGTSTSTPVIVLAAGPAKYAERVRGLIDNSDIGKIITDALLGR